MFQFTAMLRISDKLTEEEKQQRVDDVVESLDLKKCLDTRKWWFCITQLYHVFTIR